MKRLFCALIAVSTVAYGQPSLKKEIRTLQAPPVETRAHRTTEGLVLKLDVSLAPETTNTINFKVNLTNTGTHPIQLTYTNTGYGKGPDSYSEYFSSAISLETKPPVYHPMFGSAGTSTVPNVVTHQLGAGESLSTRWTGVCGRLFPAEYNVRWLAEPGRYMITACFDATVAGDDNVIYRLVSKPVTLDFGRSAKKPVRTLTEIIEVDKIAREFVIGVGATDGVRVGQHWRTYYQKARWDCVVTSVGPRRARMELTANGMASKEEAFEKQLNDNRGFQIKAGHTAWRADTSQPPKCNSNDNAAAGVSWPVYILLEMKNQLSKHPHWVITGLVLLFVGMRAGKKWGRVRSA